MTVWGVYPSTPAPPEKQMMGSDLLCSLTGLLGGYLVVDFFLEFFGA
jgi:hypothetical protein